MKGNEVYERKRSGTNGNEVRRIETKFNERK